jgi:hypothetical protein
VVETADEVWQHAAGVRQNDQEIRMAVHYPAKDQVTGSNRSVEWITN